MNTQNWIAAVAAGVSFVSMIVAVVAARINWLNTKRSISIAFGQIELQMFNTVRTARVRHEEIVSDAVPLLEKVKSDLNADEKRRLLLIQQRLKYAVEEYLNSMELICGLYRDDKVDKSRVKLFYFLDIKRICEDKSDEFKNLMVPRDTSPYKAIWLVYNEWHVHEK